MPVNFDIKGQLAKLLATEDLIIENKKVETASFNVGTRVLTLPMWDKATNNVYDLLVSHEVGHALFTPDVDWSIENPMPPQFVNVCEDVRIEKLMKRKYMGLAKTFYNGYNELSDDDFFSIENEDIDNFNLADRINLHFKIGNFVNIPFSTSEKKIVDLVSNTETFEEVLKVSKILYDYCKEENDKNNESGLGKNEQISSEMDEGSIGESSEKNTDEMSDKELLDLLEKGLEGGESERPDLGEDETEYEDDLEEDMEDFPVLESSTPTEPEVQTANSLDSKLKNLLSDDRVANEYIEIPELNLDTIISKNDEIHSYINKVFSDFVNDVKDSDELEHPYYEQRITFEEVDGDYRNFKKSAQKEVGYLVKEFECRKAADNYSRSATSRTGILSTEKLHTYRFNEDLFKRVNIVPDGKNHGLIFILDWSGSMGNIMEDTIKQLYNLIWFCKKVSIPFQVYAFTQEYRGDRTGYYGRDEKLSEHYEAKDNLFLIDSRFSLMEFFTSDVSTKVLEEQMKNIWRVVAGLRSRTVYPYPVRLSLSGTPLNEALISLHKIIPYFQKKNKLQKVQCVVLTDGEANHIPCHKTVQRHWENETYLGSRGLHPLKDYLRNRKTGCTYKVPSAWFEFTSIILKDLKDTFPNVNFIGIRILEPREATHFIRRYTGYTDSESIIKKWRKDKSFSLKLTGYEKYFGLSSNALNEETDFEVKEDATKGQIKSAFAKSLKNKKINKKVLGEFVDLIV